MAKPTGTLSNDEIIKEVLKMKSKQPREFSYEEVQKALALKDAEVSRAIDETEFPDEYYGGEIRRRLRKRLNLK